MKLREKNCKPVIDEAPLSDTVVEQLMQQLIQDWQLEGNTVLYFDFSFRNFHETMAFVNALAWIAHQQDHHPDLEVGYKHCLVRYSTHSIGGLSENDFICAARIEHLISQ